MNKTTQIILGIVVLALIVWGVAASFGDDVEVSESITIGAILPMSGSVSIWGDTFREGMEMARKDLLEDGVTINIIYQDSQGVPKEGVSAYNKLVHTDNVDAIFSIFSRVSVPLVSLADNDKIPLVMSLVAAKNAPAGSPYAFRLFTESGQYGAVFYPALRSIDAKDVAILYINDEFGSSVSADTAEALTEKGFSVVASESYLSADTDYRTQLTKIKSKNPDALIFIGIPPISLQRVITQSRELGLDVPIMESAGILMLSTSREDFGDLAEGIYTAVESAVVDGSNNRFIKEYQKANNGKLPDHPILLGYDAVHLFAQALEEDDSLGLEERIQKIGVFRGVSGAMEITEEGEINPDLISARVENGVLVPIK